VFRYLQDETKKGRLSRRKSHDLGGDDNVQFETSAFAQEDREEKKYRNYVMK
jgi:hypothetical protein